MNWIVSTLTSSIGKKLMMAITGLSFCGFLTVHLAGNLTIYGGSDAFNSYSAHLHSLGPLVTIAELLLLSFALIHVITGLTLFLQNLMARPLKYHVKKSAGGRTIGSSTMPYTGIYLLTFIIIHLINFHFADRSQRTIAQIVTQAFSNPIYVIFYVFSMIIVAIHISHGFWSAFQTLGGNHEKYTPIIRFVSIAFSIAMGFGFGLIPLYLKLL